jgi:Cu/Ag efflux protein CusF
MGDTEKANDHLKSPPPASRWLDPMNRLRLDIFLMSGGPPAGRDCNGTRRCKGILLCGALAALVFSTTIHLAAWQRGNTPSARGNAEAPASGSRQARTAYTFRGTVAAVEAKAQTVVVNNQNVPGWMPPMTMRYHVSNAAVLRLLKAGDQITAQVYAGEFDMLYRVRALPRVAGRARDLPPLSYVCPTSGEEGVIEDRPGKCPTSGHALVPVRLTIAYSCLRGPAFVQSKPGSCAYDKSPLVPVTASEFWSCQADASRRYLEPGVCDNGTVRKQEFEIRPHGDHNPRHGGMSIFMSSDLLHHVEGTFVAPGIFRVYFYDEYTRPMAATGFSAHVVPTDENATETGDPVALAPSTRTGGNSMEARIRGSATPTKAVPLDFKLHVKFTRGGSDWITDYHFAAYSKEPPLVHVPSLAPSPLGSAVATTAPVVPNGPAAVSTVGEALPISARNLLALLTERAASVKSLLDEGNFGALWFPAIGAKDVALALEARHGGELSDVDRIRSKSAVHRLTLIAWQIDAAGDLGNKQRLQELWGKFAAAASEIEGLYGASH